MRRVTERKMAETPQPMYVINVRIVDWMGSVIGCLERSCKHNIYKVGYHPYIWKHDVHKKLKKKLPAV